MTVLASGFHLRLLSRFELSLRDRVISVPPGPQRLVTFLALHNGALPRGRVAGTLWPDVPVERANANLRASIWRIPVPCRPVVELSRQHIRLAPDVTVDLTAAIALARRLLDRSLRCNEEDLSVKAREELCSELLPTCYEEWVLVECERFHQLRLHALEALCERLTGTARFGEAVDAGLAAVCAEPLRESAHRVLIKAYLAEGNAGEAGRQYEIYRRFVRDELGVEPSKHMRMLMLGVPIRACTRDHSAQLRKLGLTDPALLPSRPQQAPGRESPLISPNDQDYNRGAVTVSIS
jgi:DNA-binding SARP family transcriptional activator